MLLEILQYDFMVRAFVVGVLTAISAGVLGNFIVAGRQAVVSDMLAHTALVGVGLGIFLDLSPTYMWFGATFVFALLLWFLTRNGKQAPEAMNMFLLSWGLALALLLVHLNKNNSIALDTYLFGSILTVTTMEMYVYIGITLCMITLLVCFWKPFFILVFDTEFFQISYKKHSFYEILFLMLVATMVGMSLKVVGGLLLGALLIAPVLIANIFCSSFRINVMMSIVCNIFAVCSGLVLSYLVDIPTSSGIVLSLVGLYICAQIFASIFRRS